MTLFGLRLPFLTPAILPSLSPAEPLLHNHPNQNNNHCHCKQSHTIKDDVAEQNVKNHRPVRVY